MLKGLWNLHLVSQFRNIDAGVFEFSDSKIRGGNSDFSYMGDFDLFDGILSGELNAVSTEHKPHAIFGHLDRIRILLHGNVQSHSMHLTGYLAENPAFKIGIECTRSDRSSLQSEINTDGDPV